LASRLISKLSAVGQSRQMRLIIFSISRGSSNEGVPPPKKMLVTVLVSVSRW